MNRPTHRQLDELIETNARESASLFSVIWDARKLFQPDAEDDQIRDEIRARLAPSIKEGKVTMFADTARPRSTTRLTQSEAIEQINLDRRWIAPAAHEVDLRLEWTAILDEVESDVSSEGHHPDSR